MSDARKVLILRVLWSTIVLQSVMVPFFLWKGVPFTQVLLLQSLFTALLLVLETPTGYLADLFGRRIIIIIAAFCRGAAGLSFVIFRHFIGMAVAYTLVACSITLFSGADIAVFYEELQLSEQDSSSVVYRLSKFYWLPYLMSAASAIFGGWVYGRSIVVAAWANFAVTVCTIPLALTLLVRPVPVTQTDRSKPSFRALLSRAEIVYRECLQGLSNRTTALYLASSALFLLPLTATIWAFQQIWLKASLSATSMGLIFAGGNATFALGAFLTPHLLRVVSRRTAYLAGVALMVSGIGLPLHQSTSLAIGGMYLIQFVSGGSSVIHAHLINEQIINTSRSALNSAANFLSTALAVGTLALAATLAHRGSFTGMFFLVIGIFTGGTLLTALALSRHLKSARRVSELPNL